MKRNGISNARRWVAASLAGLLLVCAWGVPASADVFTPMLHAELQAVNSLGSSANGIVPGKDFISLIGVVINNPWDMLNSSWSSGDPQWQVYFQAVEPGDYGGTAMYMRSNNPWNPAATPYTELGWYQEMERLNYPNQANAPLQRGDLIRVDARAPGMFYGGKYNINEQHSVDPTKNFDITILDRGLTPQASLIDLADLKDESNAFIFDQTRATGGEHFQGSLVRLDNLTLLSDPSEWVLDGTVEVGQGSLTMDLKLGLDPALLALTPQAGSRFSVTAILDQEMKQGGSLKGDYRLWLTNAGDFSAVPEPGTFVLALLGGLFLYPVVRKSVGRQQA